MKFAELSTLNEFLANDLSRFASNSYAGTKYDQCYQFLFNILYLQVVLLLL